MQNEEWKKIQDFTDDHKDFLILAASPRDDAIMITFGGLRGFVKFPGKDMSEGVVFNALRESKFHDAIGPFMVGVIEGSGIKESGSGGEVLKVLGGFVKNAGKQREIIKNNVKGNAQNKNK